MSPDDHRPHTKNQVIFDHPHKNQVNPRTQNKSFSDHTQKPSQFRPPARRSSQFRSPHENQVNFGGSQVNFDLNTEIKSIPIPTLKLNQFRWPDTKTISIQKLKPSHFRPPLKNQVNSDPFTEIKSISISHTDIMSTSTTRTKPSHFRPVHQN